MPDGPAKQLIDHLDTLLAGGAVESKGRGSVVYHFGIDHFKVAARDSVSSLTKRYYSDTPRF